MAAGAPLESELGEPELRRPLAQEDTAGTETGMRPVFPGPFLCRQVAVTHVTSSHEHREAAAQHTEG